MTVPAVNRAPCRPQVGAAGRADKCAVLAIISALAAVTVAVLWIFAVGLWAIFGGAV